MSAIIPPPSNRLRCRWFTGLVALCMGCGLSQSRDVWQPADFDAALLDPTHAIWSESAPAVFQARFGTSKGNFVVEVHRDWAPRGADRFYNLVRTRFFDDSRFYRVRAGFIAQFGLPGDPRVTAVWVDHALRDDSVVQSNVRGTIAYAMTGPDTRTTQLYINLADNSRLDEQGFAPIGRIVEGMEQVVDNLYAEYDEAAGGGMRGGQQGKIIAGANTHLDAEFPNLDKLIKATVVRPD